jgi:hypothetical protein
MLLTFIALPMLFGAQHTGTTRPHFADYPAQITFTGTPTTPRLTTPATRMFRTRILRGAAGEEGFWRGAEYIDNVRGPNYAGHYRVLNWGCGSGCSMMVVVDLETGEVHPPPLANGTTGTDQIIIPNLGTGSADFDFKLDSRLFIMRTCPWGSRDPHSPLYRGNGFCGTSYFTIAEDGFHVVRRVREELIPVPE